jgi:hypothetical protein
MFIPTLFGHQWIMCIQYPISPIFGPVPRCWPKACRVWWLLSSCFGFPRSENQLCENRWVTAGVLWQHDQLHCAAFCSDLTARAVCAILRVAILFQSCFKNLSKICVMKGLIIAWCFVPSRCESEIVIIFNLIVKTLRNPLQCRRQWEPLVSSFWAPSFLCRADLNRVKLHTRSDRALTCALRPRTSLPLSCGFPQGAAGQRLARTAWDAMATPWRGHLSCARLKRQGAIPRTEGCWRENLQDLLCLMGETVVSSEVSLKSVEKYDAGWGNRLQTCRVQDGGSRVHRSEN